MIPNIVTGGDTGGLMRYLVGPGRANEHENPHVIAGSRDSTTRSPYRCSSTLHAF